LINCPVFHKYSQHRPYAVVPLVHAATVFLFSELPADWRSADRGGGGGHTQPGGWTECQTGGCVLAEDECGVVLSGAGAAVKGETHRASGMRAES